ncbi:RecX family transcriptional regulator [candidate division WWE3 bacterium]|nr:RecX family transcriptional regulator [candidate division WWE3 bacterium]
MRITKISLQRNKKAFNIFVDGKYSFSLSEEDVVKEGLKAGLEIGEQRLLELKFKGKRSYYLNRAYNFLSFRPRSEKEIKDKLKEISFKEKGLEENLKTEVENFVMEKLKKMRLFDDREFGKWYVSQRKGASKPSGRQRIKSELYAKGLDRRLIEELLEDKKGEGALASLAAEKKTNSLKGLEEKDFRKKLMEHLLRRGFEWDVVLSAVDTISKRKYNKSEFNPE